MPPRRGRQSPDPEGEREVFRERSSHGQNIEMESEIRNLRARIEDMEVAQRRTEDIGDLSDSEGEADVVPQGGVGAEDAANE